MQSKHLKFNPKKCKIMASNNRYLSLIILLAIITHKIQAQLKTTIQITIKRVITCPNHKRTQMEDSNDHFLLKTLNQIRHNNNLIHSRLNHNSSNLRNQLVLKKQLLQYDLLLMLVQLSKTEQSRIFTNAPAKRSLEKMPSLI